MKANHLLLHEIEKLQKTLSLKLLNIWNSYVSQVGYHIECETAFEIETFADNQFLEENEPTLSAIKVLDKLYENLGGYGTITPSGKYTNELN